MRALSQLYSQETMAVDSSVELPTNCSGDSSTISSVSRHSHWVGGFYRCSCPHHSRIYEEPQWVHWFTKPDWDRFVPWVCCCLRYVGRKETYSPGEVREWGWGWGIWIQSQGEDHMIIKAKTLWAVQLQANTGHWTTRFFLAVCKSTNFSNTLQPPTRMLFYDFVITVLKNQCILLPAQGSGGFLGVNVSEGQRDKHTQRVKWCQLLTGSPENRLSPPFQKEAKPGSQAFKEPETSKHSYKVTENRKREAERGRWVSGIFFREMCVNVSSSLPFLTEDMS